MERRANADMSLYTSFRAGGRARELVVCFDKEELRGELSRLSASGEPFVFLGNGSNTLFRDGLYRGTVVKAAGSFERIELLPDGRIRAGAAALLGKAARFALSEGLSGMEALSGIPGSVGGALFMNAGAYGSEMKDIVADCVVLRRTAEASWEEAALSVEELALGYRRSALQESGDIVISVDFKLDEGRADDIARRMTEFATLRQQKQPLDQPSAGSFFKRPEGRFAGALIDKAGLKGLSVGGAMVSPRHAGFIVNTGEASAGDIIELMHLVQDRVQDRFGVRLEPEVRII